MSTPAVPWAGTRRIDARPHPERAIVLRHRAWSARVDTRAAGVTAGAVVALAVALVWSLSIGDFPLSATDVLSALVGHGNPDSRAVVWGIRLPRASAAVLVGGAFGLSGAIFQRLAGNPLASPDIIGINAGASLGAVTLTVVVHASSVGVAAGAAGGALAAALAVYLLAYRQGVTGYRLILVGIGVTAILQSLLGFLMTRAQLTDASRALIWLVGSLNGRGWEHVEVMGVVLAVAGPVALVLARPLRAMEVGDDAALGLGVRVGRARGGLVLVGVVLAAVATGVAGPVAFVALGAPQIARRLVRARTTALVPAAVVGAVLLVVSDLVGQHLAASELPVGVVTGLVGAPYLLVLLVRANRIGTAG